MSQSDNHACHAADCTAHVAPEMLMCRKHWFMVPRDLQRRVWATYRPGQCDDWQPSKAYCEAAKAAVIAVAEKEGKTLTENHPAILLYDVFARGAR